MPISLKLDADKEIELGVWKTSEDSTYFHNKLEIHEPEKSIIEQLNTKKLLEWLSSRYLLHLMSGRTVRGAFIKDIHGKPHLQNSNFHISISHSRDLVAVVASQKIVGVDIQYFVSKIHRIQHKFVNENELSHIQESQMLEALHIIWGAKESLYKAYGKRGLDFKKNILISELSITGNNGQFRGQILKDNYNKQFNLTFHLFDNHSLVYAKEHI